MRPVAEEQAGSAPRVGHRVPLEPAAGAGKSGEELLRIGLSLLLAEPPLLPDNLLNGCVVCERRFGRHKRTICRRAVGEHQVLGVRDALEQGADQSDGVVRALHIALIPHQGPGTLGALLFFKCILVITVALLVAVVVLLVLFAGRHNRRCGGDEHR